MPPAYTAPAHDALVALYEWLDALDVAGRLGRGGHSVREDFQDGVLAAEALSLELRAAPIGFVPCLPKLARAHSKEQMRLNWETLDTRVIQPVLEVSLAAEDIDAVVCRVPFAAENILVEIQAALFTKMTASAMEQRKNSRALLREHQCDAYEQAFQHFRHHAQVQQRRRRRSRRLWYP